MLPSGTFTDRLYLVTSQGQSELPTPGTNQVWDLSTATLLDIGTFTHQPAAATPYASTYAQANIAWHMNMGAFGTNYTYLALGTHLDMVATDVPEEPNVYTDLLRVLNFPLAFGTSFSDTWAGTAGSGTVTWTYAGHGTALTPVGSFNDVVLLVNDGGEVALWRTNPLVPLLLVRDGFILAVGPAATVGLAEMEHDHLHVYPVPCHDRLLVQATAASPWRIVDLQGRTVREGRFAATGTATVETDALLPGAYQLVQTSTNAVQVARFIKE